MAEGNTKATTNHDVIQRWAEERGGQPATVKATGDAEQPGILRIDFPGYSGEGSLERVGWDQFFDKFDEERLAFIFQEQTKDGDTSRFSKFVERDTAREAADEWVE